jgi:ATP-dependent protease ClpP protease subunit
MISIKGPIVDNMTGWVYHYLGLDAACPGDLKKALEEAGGDDVAIEFNSKGGLCSAGFEMYKQLRDYDGKITAHIIEAMSAATVIACGADETLMSDAAIYMIHNTQSMAMGDYRDMEMEAQALREYNKAIIGVYARKTGMTKRELQKLMDNDTFMSPETAIEKGFADGYIYGEPEKLVAVAAHEDIISPKKAKELYMMLNADSIAEKEGKFSNYVPATSGTDKDGISYEIFVAENGGDAFLNKSTSDVSDDGNKEGGNEMTLSEFLTTNPEAQAEFDALMNEAIDKAGAEEEAVKEEAVSAAREEGAKAERERIKSLDEIAKSVTKEALNDAKYGDICDAKELAYRAMKEENLRDMCLADAYMNDAMEDASVADEVKAEPEEAQVSDAERIANYVNAKKEVK